MSGSPVTGLRTARRRLVSTYYDTPDHVLAHRGSTLRVRRLGRQFIQTVKATHPPGAGGISRGEWEDRIRSERPDPHAEQTGPFLSPEIAARLRPLFRTEVSRLTIPLAPEPATCIEAAIDRGRICNGVDTAPEPISEVELELKSGAPTALYDVALKLLNVAPLRLERRSKAERGYHLAMQAPAAVAAVHAAPVDLQAELSGEAALRRIGQAGLGHLLDNEAAVVAGDAEGVHQMRVAVRRLRAVLSTFAPVLPEPSRRWASNRLRWFGSMLGDARNLDVFVTDLLPPARAALPEASEFERLSRAAERHRQAAHAAAAKAIASSHYTEGVLTLMRWFDGDDWRGGADGALREPIAALAPMLLDRCRAKTEKRARHFAGQSAERRHRLRIALKKLRYAAELFAGIHDLDAAKLFIQRLKKLQDDLGDANDVSTARDIVDELAPGGKRVTGVAHAGRRVIKWHEHRVAENEPELRRHLEQLLDAEPFWQGAEA